MRLHQGDLVCFNNRRILHGRNSFNLNGGVRHFKVWIVENSALSFKRVDRVTPYTLNRYLSSPHCSIHFLWSWKGEFVEQSGAYLNVWFSNDDVRRNWIFVSHRDWGVKDLAYPLPVTFLISFPGLSRKNKKYACSWKYILSLLYSDTWFFKGER